MMGWMAGTIHSWKERKSIPYPRHVVEASGYTGKTVTVIDSTGTPVFKIKRLGRHIYNTQQQAMKESNQRANRNYIYGNNLP